MAMFQAPSVRRGDHVLLIGAISAAAVSLGALLSCHSAAAQDATQAAIERSGPASPEKRAELLRQLASQAQVLQQQTALVKTVAKLVGPTVVHVEADVSAHTTLSFGQGRHVEEAGSGVVIELGGKHYVLTNRHVVSGAKADGISITLADGRQIHPMEVWDDPETDVAVMHVSAPDLVAALLGDSDRMEIGDFVLAMGSPFGLSRSVTYGIISAKGRRDLELGASGVRLQDFLQTDAAFNPGNSGGPLVNLRGEVIGINTAIASNSGGSEGIGFSIPIKMFMHVARQLIEKKGKVARAFLGVKLEPSFSAAMAAEMGLPRPTGARIKEVTAGTPAAAIDLHVGDVILEFNNVPVEDDDHLVNLVSFTEIGKKVTLVIFRDRATFRVEVAVADKSQLLPAR